jgi:hypothetical protein
MLQAFFPQTIVCHAIVHKTTPSRSIILLASFYNERQFPASRLLANPQHQLPRSAGRSHPGLGVGNE